MYYREKRTNKILCNILSTFTAGEFRMYIVCYFLTLFPPVTREVTWLVLASFAIGTWWEFREDTSPYGGSNFFSVK
jgi:hypothetical protein